LGAEGAFLTGLELQGAHVAGHAVAAAGDAGLAEADCQARAAIELAAGFKEGGQGFLKALVFLRPFAGFVAEPGVVGAARHAESQADGFEWVLLSHKLDQGIPPGGRSESMPIAFFKISWWSLSLAFSLRRR